MGNPIARIFAVCPREQLFCLIYAGKVQNEKLLSIVASISLISGCTSYMIEVTKLLFGAKQLSRLA
jgi:hypothetical protein